MTQIERILAAGLAGMLIATGSAQAAASDYVENMDFSKTVTISWSGEAVDISNAAGSGVAVSKNGADVSIESNTEGVEYILSGKSSAGSLKITGIPACKITLNSIDLSASYSPAVTVNTTNGCHIVIEDDSENSLADGLTTLEDIPGAVYSSGPLAISGNGSLDVTVRGEEHGIYSPTNMWIRGGDISVSGSPKDALHVGGTFIMDNGTLHLKSESDAIDADLVFLNGGNIQIDSTNDNTEGIKCDGDMLVNGGNLNVCTAGARSKSLSCGGNLEINRGSMAFLISGDVYLKPITNSICDAKYCAGISVDGDLTLNDGSVVMTHTGLGGKGISVDGNMVMNAGTIDIAASGGASGTFTNEDGETDIASTDCVKVDGNLSILGGRIDLLSTGAAGDCISAGGTMTFGVSGVTNFPVVCAETTGDKVDNYGNPKAAASGGSITIDGGTITLATASDGGEGLESKNDITINGGRLTVSAYDDCIQAASENLDSIITINGGTVFCTGTGNGEGIESKGDMVINGGHIEITAGDDCINVTKGQNSGTLIINDGLIYCYSSNNDGIDSNGDMTINGGFIIASGTDSPEESFDSNTALYLNGGTQVGTAGSGFMCPVSSQNGHCSILYAGTLTAGDIVQVQLNGSEALVYEIPRSWGSTPYLLFSSPEITTGTSGTILTGGTVSGGTKFHGYYTGATVSGGTQAETFTISSTGLTEIGSAGGGTGPQPPRW